MPQEPSKMYQFPTPMEKIYQGDPGSPEWVEGKSRTIQYESKNMSANNVRRLCEEMEAVRRYAGWNKWPNPPAKTPGRWLERVLGVSVSEFLEAIAVFSKEDAERLSWLLPEDREKGAENIGRGGDHGNQHTGGKRCDTPFGNDHQTVSAIQRRLQRRANAGDTEAADLLRQIDAGEISTNKAAQLAGMRKEYLRIPKKDPAAAAERIRVELGEDFARQLKEAL
jgi:hypothetical protein